MAHELGQSVDGFRPECRGITRDCSLTRLFDARHAPVQRRNEFLELAGEVRHAHRHPWPRLNRASRREAFQTSPQPPHRQYVCSSGFLADVAIAVD